MSRPSKWKPASCFKELMEQAEQAERLAETLPALTRTQELIGEVCDDLNNMLVDKNRGYGDSALNPIRIFSKATAYEQLLVRIDDKLSRLKTGDANTEDTVKDLAGYLVLYMVKQRVDRMVDQRLDRLIQDDTKAEDEAERRSKI